MSCIGWVGLWLLVAGISFAQVTGTIHGPAARKYPVAVSALKDVSENGAAAALSTEFSDVLARDLHLSALFRIIPRDAHIEPAETSGTTVETINFDNWSAIGALLLVKGTVAVQGEEVVIEARLFDVYQRRQLTGRRYRGTRADVRRMAHRFADEILHYHTRQRGPFDSRIVFLSRRDGRFRDVYVMDPDGSNVRRVTKTNTLNLAPSWSPRKDSILFTSYRHGNPDLFSIGLNTGEWRRISSARGLNLGGRWSPDGTRIAVAREEAGNTDLYVLNPDGKVQYRLTDHWGIDVSPSWSPDGRRLAFCSDRAGSPQIYVVDAAGGSPYRVTYEGSYNTSPSWSPAGDRIAYATRIGGRFQVRTVSIDGTDVRKVTQNPGDNEDPSWSPDGRYLVFSSTRSGKARIYLSPADGSEHFELTEGNGDDTSPSWSGWLE